jgi:mRNA interferase MazF
LIMVLPHTTTIIGSEYEIQIPVRWLQRGAFNIQASFPLAPPKFIRKLGALDAGQLGLVEAKLKHWEGLV